MAIANQTDIHTSTTMSPPAVAVIGCGYWGRHLVRNYHELGALRLLCDKNEALLEQFGKQYPDLETCLAFNEVLAGKEIDAVVISTPAETHYRLAREALLADKHVYVEKPLVLKEEEGLELIRLARERSRILMVGHLLQYHPAFVHLKALAGSGELGRINYIYSHRLNLGKVRREENILWSFAPHDISMILALAREQPENVSATGGNYLHQNIADVTTTHLEFPSGLRAHIFVSWLHPFKEQKLVVVGDRKMAVFDDTQTWPDKLLLYPHEIKWQNNIPVAARAEPERLDIPPAEPLKLECGHFLDCVRSGRIPFTDGQEGLRVLKVLTAAQLSLNENGRKVRMRLPAAYISSSNDYYAHPTAVIDEGAEIGTGTKIWHFSHILSGSRIGARCSIGQNVAIGSDVAVGNGCKIQNNVSIYKGVTLEDEVFCGPSVVFTNVYNPRAHIPRMNEIRKTLVKKGATIGANATIVCGRVIGEYAFIGAGSVVTKDVCPYALMVGNPARRIAWVCACGTRLDEKLACKACGKTYIEKGGMVSEIQ